MWFNNSPEKQKNIPQLNENNDNLPENINSSIPWDWLEESEVWEAMEDYNYEKLDKKASVNFYNDIIEPVCTR